jgi:hypothetical protein
VAHLAPGAEHRLRQPQLDRFRAHVDHRVPLRRVFEQRPRPSA